MLALPLMSCSARLPVYILVVGTVFAGQSFGWFSAGAVALFSMYTLSVLVTLGAAPPSHLSRRCGHDHLGNDDPPLGPAFFSEVG